MTLKAWWRSKRPAVLSFPIFAIVRLIGMTVKIETPGYDRYRQMQQSMIFAGWHGRTLLAANFFRGKGIWTIISQSNDGDLQNRIFKRFGFHTIRGSTGRGGAKALIECIKILRAGATMAFTPDGPRGPSGIVQDGIMVMAQKSGAILVPVGVSATRRWLAPTWDKYMIPKPFSRAVMIFGEPIHVPQNGTAEEVESARKALETAMHELERQAEQKMGHSV
jgi:lysophospholipid acyltransferase (LPLAT)-like uncharacterized protein